MMGKVTALLWMIPELGKRFSGHLGDKGRVRDGIGLERFDLIIFRENRVVSRSRGKFL